MLNTTSKKKIIDALLELRKNYDGSDGQFAKMWGIHPTAWSGVKNGKVDNLVADERLVTIGRKLGVALADAPQWSIVGTETFNFITEQLRVCQQEQVSRMLVDIADIGKTTAAKQFMLTNRNVFYVDCSQNKTLRLFIKALAGSMGVSTNNNLHDIIADIKYSIQGTVKPLVVLDEFGDLEYRAFMEVKGLWNGTEGCCAWYAMGADGLKLKMERGIAGKRVGFTEIFRRFGTDYMTIRKPMTAAEEQVFKLEHIRAIIQGNMPDAKVKDLLPRSDRTGDIYSLTRVKERIIKIKRETTII